MMDTVTERPESEEEPAAAAAAPEAASPAFHLALLYLQIDKPDLAKQYLQSAQALDPDGPIGAQAARVLERYFP